jgi:hypothetical protein
MLVSDLIKSSMRKLGLLASGETPTTSEYADALSALQSMLRSLPASKINVFSSVKESHTLTAGTGTYTWGSGGVINTARPNKLIGAYILDSSNTSHQVGIITEGQYRVIPVKTTTGRPYSAFLYSAYPLSTLYLYPVPDAAETLYLDSIKPFTETSSFDVIGSTLSFPLYYEEFFIYNLAIRIAPEFGKEVPAAVVAVATSSYTRIITLNAAGQLEPIAINVPAGLTYGAGYSINSDSSR